jgi:hypothetical protein
LHPPQTTIAVTDQRHQLLESIMASRCPSPIIKHEPNTNT